MVSSNSNTTTGQLQHSSDAGCQHQSWGGAATRGGERLRDVTDSLRLISVRVSHEASNCQHFLDEIILIWIFILIWQNMVFMQRRRGRDQRSRYDHKMERFILFCLRRNEEILIFSKYLVTNNIHIMTFFIGQIIREREQERVK